MPVFNVSQSADRHGAPGQSWRSLCTPEGVEMSFLTGDNSGPPNTITPVFFNSLMSTSVADEKAKAA